ncbi:MAG: class III signal peptide-containing protein [Methanosphaera sp.]|nr:class III signal peptide-containing protein [Methanosphaera sp.]
MKILNIISDTKGQGVAEYILLFGGVIIIALVALQIYSSYFNNGSTFNAHDDAEEIRANLST